MLRRLFLSALLTISLTTSGCAPLLVGAAVGAGSVAYAKGSLQQVFDEPVDKLYRASLSALKDTGCKIHSKHTRNRLAKIQFTFNDGKKGTIHIEPLTERSAKLKIRVGVLGDETKSQIILNAISKHL